MRFVCTLLVMLGLSGQAAGQVRTEARTTWQGDISLPHYRMIRTNGQILYLVDYEKKGQFYFVTDTRRKVTQHFVGSVRSIEPLSKAEAIKVADQLSEPGSSTYLPTPRTMPRNKAREAPRTASGLFVKTPPLPRRAPDPEPVPSPLSDDSSSLGYTPRGFALQMGPRGGIYHISKNGNKVYHSKK
jgi:hypothetical protein